MTMTAKEVEQYRKEMNEKSSRSGSNTWFSMKADTTIYFRIAPPWKKNGEIWKDVIIHQIGGKGKSIRVYCAHNDIDKKTGKPRPCPVCRRKRKLQEEPKTKVSRKLWGYCSEQVQSLWNVFIASKVKTLDSGKVIIKEFEEDKAKIWQLSRKWHGEMIEIFTEEEYRTESANGVADLRVGRVVRAKRIGKELDTEYKFKVIGDPVPISKSKETRIALKATINDLDKVVKGSSDEELKAFVRTAEKAAKAFVRNEEAESDGDDELDDEIEEETKKHKKSSDDENDDDEEDDDGDEEIEEDEDE